ncbi:uncharacterized protein M6B38_203655 [Iris pallida]|uniref:Uncharacterized protein n=1 Tax=Iris pallida TaxID=29817 RepID=A0AAX6E6S6_IRIPA|nr:uncharacterized protein M6B38_203655 [Iris pallida]
METIENSLPPPPSHFLTSRLFLKNPSYRREEEEEDQEEEEDEDLEEEEDQEGKGAQEEGTHPGQQRSVEAQRGQLLLGGVLMGSRLPGSEDLVVMASVAHGERRI